MVIGGRRRRSELADSAATGEFERLADYTGRGVVTTATYAAREFGVHSGLGLMKAAKLCPAGFAAAGRFRRIPPLFQAF